MYFNSSPYSLLATNPKVPLLYSLPKIHKEGIPIRPIVSFIVSPVYKTSIFLNKTFKSNLPLNFEFSLQNSSKLVKLLIPLDIPDNCFPMSFDVKNLFPSVPSSECVDIINNLLSHSDLNDLIVDDLS